jgi:cytochrome c-type biogenesis protein CcmH
VVALAARAAPPPVPATLASSTLITTGHHGYIPGEAWVEGRLMAPCCWQQTIDIHQSEVARSMRQEVRRRLLAGQTPNEVLAVFVKRYGPRILAIPPENPIKKVATFLWAAFGVAGVGAVGLLVRWRRRSGPKPPSGGSATKDADAPKTEAVHDELDDRIDDELDKL